MRQSYDELNWQLGRLRAAAADGKLYMVLGAGVSAAYGLLDWRDLLLELMQATGRLRLPEDHRSPTARHRLGTILSTVIVDPLLQAEAARTAYGTAERWAAALRKQLTTEGVDITSNRGAIGNIADLVIEQHRRRPEAHVAVLTFNYDDLLERAIEQRLGSRNALNVVASADSFKATSIDEPGVYIYHLHGALSDPSAEIVLSAESYARLLGAPANHWSWDCMKQFLWSQPHSGAILLGLSLVDPSIRLLLSEATKLQNLSALFITNPFPPLAASGGASLTIDREIAYAAHDMQTIFDEALETLSLVPYHVSEWDEVRDILERVKPEADE